MSGQELAAYGGPRHLARRALSSLRPGGPDVAGAAWALRWLTPHEQKLWARMPGADRRHAVEVSKRVALALDSPDGAGLPSAVLAAALLHDIGKIESGFGTGGRILATLTTLTLGRDRVAGWAGRRPGWRQWAGLYVTHDEAGRRLLERAGSDPLVVAWAAEHHLPEQQWSIDPVYGAALKAADDD